MRVLMVHKHFWPDTPPYALMLKTISGHLATNGHDVSIYSAQPSYKASSTLVKKKEVLVSGVIVRRLRLISSFYSSKLTKLIDFAYFPFRVFIHLLLNRYDVVTVSTAPPVVLVGMTALACKLIKAKLVYHCMDIHPEIGKLSGEFSRPIIFNILRRIDNWALQRSARVIVLSKDMQRTLQNRALINQSELAFNIINNFALKEDSLVDENKIRPLLKKEGVFRMIFAGNLGRFQGLELLIEAMNTLESEEAELVFLGEGKALRALKEQTNSDVIKFFPHMNINDAKALIADADIGVVSLQKNILNYAFPSKTMTYLEQSCPIFAIIEENSDMANFIIKNKIGVVAKSGSLESVKTQLSWLTNNRNSVIAMKNNTKQCYQEYFSEDVVLSKWQNMILEMEVE